MITRETLLEMAHDKVLIGAISVFAAVGVDPANIFRSDTPEARVFTDLVLLGAVIAIFLRLWNRSIEIRIRAIELHRKEQEFQEETAAHNAVMKAAENAARDPGKKI